MSPFFKDSIAALLQCAQRHANHEHSKVQISAFEAINDLVRSASRDTLDVVAQLITVSGSQLGSGVHSWGVTGYSGGGHGVCTKGGLWSVLDVQHRCCSNQVTLHHSH